MMLNNQRRLLDFFRACDCAENVQGVPRHKRLIKCWNADMSALTTGFSLLRLHSKI